MATCNVENLDGLAHAIDQRKEGGSSSFIPFGRFIFAAATVSGGRWLVWSDYFYSYLVDRVLRELPEVDASDTLPVVSSQDEFRQLMVEDIEPLMREHDASGSEEYAWGAFWYRSPANSKGKLWIYILLPKTRAGRSFLRMVDMPPDGPPEGKLRTCGNCCHLSGGQIDMCTHNDGLHDFPSWGRLYPAAPYCPHLQEKAD